MPDPRSNEPGERREQPSAGPAEPPSRRAEAAAGASLGPRGAARTADAPSPGRALPLGPPRRRLRSSSSRLGGSRTPGCLPAEIYDLGSHPGPLCALDAAVRTCGWRPMGGEGLPPPGLFFGSRQLKRRPVIKMFYPPLTPTRLHTRAPRGQPKTVGGPWVDALQEAA